MRCTSIAVVATSNSPYPPIPTPQEEESLAHQIKCFEGTPQASQIKLVAEKVSARWNEAKAGYLGPLPCLFSANDAPALFLSTIACGTSAVHVVELHIMPTHCLCRCCASITWTRFGATACGASGTTRGGACPVTHRWTRWAAVDGSL